MRMPKALRMSGLWSLVSRLWSRGYEEIAYARLASWFAACRVAGLAHKNNAGESNYEQNNPYHRRWQWLW